MDDIVHVVESPTEQVSREDDPTEPKIGRWYWVKDNPDEDTEGDPRTRLLEEKETLTKRQARVLRMVAHHIQAELDRGYVLTSEGNAGPLWLSRWNRMLGEVEGVLPK